MKRLAIERSSLLIFSATICALTWAALSGNSGWSLRRELDGSHRPGVRAR